MNDRDKARLAIGKIGVGVPFRVTDMPASRNTHNTLRALYDDGELELVEVESYYRGRQKHERRVYAATAHLKHVEPEEEKPAQWSADGWKDIAPEFFSVPTMSGTLRVVTFD